MTSLNLEGRERLASLLLKTSLDEMHQNKKDLPDSRATYFWQSGRGGGALVVGEDGGVLFARSSIDFAAHVEAFRQGRRTDPALFA